MEAYHKQKDLRVYQDCLMIDFIHVNNAMVQFHEILSVPVKNKIVGLDLNTYGRIYSV